LVSDYGITNVHKIRFFPLFLSGMAFNWFVSLAPNTVNTWEYLEQKFHDYFFNVELDLRFLFGGVMSYPIFMPKPSTLRMHDLGSIVPHIHLKVLTDNQLSLI
jgi:hypothetical protein